MKVKQVKIGLIGCGDISETGHLPALLVHQDFKLTALCDVNQSRAKLLSSMGGGIPWYIDYLQMIKEHELDAIILALRPEHSVEIACDLLSRGYPILDEKPLANTYEEGLKVKEAIKRFNGKYQIGFVFRYSSLVSEIINYSEKIGTPAIYQVGVFDELWNPENKDHYEKIQGYLKYSSAMTHEGSHVVDFAQLWNKAKVKALSAVAVKTRPEFNGPNLWNVQLALEDGSVLKIDIGWFLTDFPRSFIKIYGPNGLLEIDSLTGDGFYRSNGKTEKISGIPQCQNWKKQLDLFAEFILNGVQNGASIEDGLHVLRITEDCQIAERTRQTISYKIN